MQWKCLAVVKQELPRWAMCRLTEKGPGGWLEVWSVSRMLSLHSLRPGIPTPQLLPELVLLDPRDPRKNADLTITSGQARKKRFSSSQEITGGQHRCQLGTTLPFLKIMYVISIPSTYSPVSIYHRERSSFSLPAEGKPVEE